MLKSKVMRPIALTVAAAILLSSCATVDSRLADSSGGSACAMGAVVGALAGAALATAVGKDAGKGAAIGGALGCGATYMYQQRVKRLNKIAQEEGLKMQVSEVKASAPASSDSTQAQTQTQPQVVGIEAQVEDSAMFAVGSATITPDGQRQLGKIAAVLADNQKDKVAVDKKILVVGHTDATGSAEFNQRLSEQRARAVGQILAEAGIPAGNIFYQGAGASRPVADNTTEQGRAQNRRVEMTELDNQQLLVERVRSEQNSPKYLTHGTATKQQQKDKEVSISTPRKPARKPKAKEPASSVATAKPISKPTVIALEGNGAIDFGGAPVTDIASKLVQGIKPKSSGFSIIPTAYASEQISSCVIDAPRMTGDVKNLASDRSLSEHSTNDHFPGMNGRPWGKDVNGHVVLVGPISILKDDAQIDEQPFMQFISNYKTNKDKNPAKIHSVANTYEGEDQILYRVFAIDSAASPVSCMDIVFNKRSGAAVAGEIIYPKWGEAYSAIFLPVRR